MVIYKQGKRLEDASNWGFKEEVALTPWKMPKMEDLSEDKSW